MMKKTIHDFLTETQINRAIQIFEEGQADLHARLQREVIEPNMAEINRKLGQENDASYLAYAVEYVLQQAVQ